MQKRTSKLGRISRFIWEACIVIIVIHAIGLLIVMKITSEQRERFDALADSCGWAYAARPKIPKTMLKNPGDPLVADSNPYTLAYGAGLANFYLPEVQTFVSNESEMKKRFEWNSCSARSSKVIQQTLEYWKSGHAVFDAYDYGGKHIEVAIKDDPDFGLRHLMVRALTAQKAEMITWYGQIWFAMFNFFFYIFGWLPILIISVSVDLVSVLAKRTENKAPA